MTFNVLDIIKGTTVDGPGFRTAIYLSGCRHACPACHNPQSHDPAAGNPMTLEEILEVVRAEDFDVTLTGGDPLYDPESTAQLAKAIKALGYNIWLYTGYTWEQVSGNERYREILDNIDVMVDGRFVEQLKDPDLLFRGSSNQRLIDIRATLQSRNFAIPILWQN